MYFMEKGCRESVDVTLAGESKSAHVHQADEGEDDADDHAGIGAHFRVSREVAGLVGDSDDRNHHAAAG